jgi:site-specific DNA-cytosine methylase
MKYFSMFSGIGGFELGIQRATNNSRHASPLSVDESVPSSELRSPTATCVGYSEIDKYATQHIRITLWRTHKLWRRN